MFGSPRLIYICFAISTLLLGAALLVLNPAWLIPWLVLFALTLIGAWDLQSKHNVLRNYPILGHIRYLLEFVRPEIRQYFFESNQSGRPFNREQREIVDKRADGLPDTEPFGTTRDIDGAGFDFAQHSISPKKVDQKYARLIIGGPQCSKPYNSSRLNISAMSFGALSSTAVLAMNKGAKLGNFAQDTGEGAISPYHQVHGGDLIWEIGSGYFGCRTANGEFDSEEFRTKASSEQVKMSLSTFTTDRNLARPPPTGRSTPWWSREIFSLTRSLLFILQIGKTLVQIDFRRSSHGSFYCLPDFSRIIESTSGVENDQQMADC